jgi:hypothetical protein
MGFHRTSDKAGVDESRACFYVSGSAVTAIVSGTEMKIAGTTTAGGCLQGFTHSNNRLTYSMSKTRWFHVNAFISMTSGTNNVTFSFYMAKNGAIISPSKIRRKLGTGADVGSITLQANIELATDDYLEVWVDADVNNNLTVSEMTTIVTDIGS